MYTVLLLATIADESSAVGDDSTADVSAAAGTGEGVDLAAQLTMLPRRVNRAASEDGSMVVEWAGVT